MWWCLGVMEIKVQVPMVLISYVLKISGIFGEKMWGVCLMSFIVMLIYPLDFPLFYNLYF